MHDTSKSLATHKSMLLGAWSPLVVMTLVSQLSRIGSLSLELTPWQMLLWPLTSLCALAGAALFMISTLELARSRRGLQTTLFTCYALWCVVLICLEGAAMNFAHVTGSLLDAPMLEYAFTNARGAWDLISASTPIWLKLILGIVSALVLSLPHVLRRKLAPLSRALPAPSKLLLSGCLLLLLPFALAQLVGSNRREANASLPSAYAVFTSILQGQDTGTAHELDYSTHHATLAPTTGKPRNVVLILLESTRASATTIHNPELDTTPFLNKLADQSLTAMHAYAVVPHTSKAVISTGCGVAPYLNVDILEASKAGIPQRCMARLFGDVGYATAFFQSATQRFERRGSLVKNMGFEEFYPLESLEQEGFKKANYFGLEDNVMLEPSMTWISSQDKPFFLTYLTVTPHHEYLAPDTYGRHDFSKNRSFNLYLNSVRYVDHFVENVIEGLKAQGVYEDTIIAIVGDHGEGFGEHKLQQHDKIMYEEGLAIPMMIHDPARPELARRIFAPVTQLDLMPTLIELSNHKLVKGSLPGLDLTKEIPEDRTLQASCWSKNACAAVIKGRQKIIHNFGRKPDELYDLDRDPKELDPLPGKIARQDIDALLDWRASVNKIYETHHEQYSKEFVSSSKLTPSTSYLAHFDDRITLYGYDLKLERDIGDQQVTVNMFFEVKGEIEPGWKMFLHGTDSKGKMKNLDHVPVEGTLPVEEFEQGIFVKDSFSFMLPESTPPGPYTLHVGFWHPKKGRMKATLDGERVKEDRPLLVSFDIDP